MAHDLPAAGPEDPRRFDVHRVDVGHRLHGGEGQREVDADEDHEDRGPVADAEGDDGERDPGNRRDRREQRDGRQRELADDREREGDTPGEDAGHEGQEQAEVSATKFAPVRSTPTAGIRNWAWLRISPMNSWGGGRMTGSIKWSAAAASHATTTSPIDRTHQTPATRTPRMRALERARVRDAVVAGRAGAAAG